MWVAAIPVMHSGAVCFPFDSYITSGLSENMFDDGFSDVTSIDYSEVVIIRLWLDRAS